MIVIIHLHSSYLPIQYAALAGQGCLVFEGFFLFPTQKKFPLYGKKL